MGPTEDAVAGTVKPPIPLPVEESRAKRLQRQQARFRDRGGIFVPSSRNTLIDILLGRKVPSTQKRRSKSLSCSPVKSKPNGFPVGGRKSTKTPALSSKRTSPRKLNKREANEEEVVQPIAGPSKRTHPAPKAKAVNKARKGKEKADESPATPKRRGRPPKAKADVATVTSGSQAKAAKKELDPEQQPKGQKRVTTTSSKIGRPRKKAEPAAAEKYEDGINGVAIIPSSTSKSSAPVTKSKVKRRKVPPPKPNPDVEIEPVNALSRPARPRREEGAYLEPSDGDTAPPAITSPAKKVEEVLPPVRNPPDKKGKGHQQLASIEEEDWEHPPEAEGPPKPRLPSKKRIRPHSDDPDDVSVKDDDIGPRKRSRAEPQSSTEPTDLVVRKPRAKKLRVDDKPHEEAVSYNNAALDDGDIGSIKRARAQPKHRHKPQRKNTDLVANESQNAKDEMYDRPRKELNQPSEDVKSHLSGKKASSKKRPLDPSEDPQKPVAKRTKVKPRMEPEHAAPTESKHLKVSHSEKDGQGTKVKLKEDIGRGAKASKPAPKEGKSSGKAPKFTPIIVPRHPPKSVLERIKEPRPQIEDDTPDPINFLS